MRGDTATITIYVEPQLKREFEQIAHAKGRNISEQGRIALAAFVLRELEKSGALRAEKDAKAPE